MRVTSETSTVATFQLKPVRTAELMPGDAAGVSSPFGTTVLGASADAMVAVFGSSALMFPSRPGPCWHSVAPAYDPVSHGRETGDPVRTVVLRARAALRDQALASLQAASTVRRCAAGGGDHRRRRNHRTRLAGRAHRQLLAPHDRPFARARHRSRRRRAATRADGGR